MKTSTPFDFYRDGLLNALYPGGVLYLARHIRNDIILSSSDRSYLLSLANHLYCSLCGRDLYFDL